MKNKLITQEQVDMIRAYLYTRPFNEVFKGISMLENLPDLEENTKPENDPEEIERTTSPRDVNFTTGTLDGNAEDIVTVRYRYWGLPINRKSSILFSLEEWVEKEINALKKIETTDDESK